MNLWSWFNDRRAEFRQAGDRERLRLTQMHPEGFGLQEVDPDGAYAVFTEARHLAEQLNEPWFVFFYDVWRVQALTSYKQDYRNVLDLAVHCVLQARKPLFEQHPWKLAAFNHLIDAYIGIDPLGHADGIRDALDYLEREIEPGPNSHRYVMLGHKRQFALDRRCLEEARAIALEELALTDADDDDHRSTWFLLPAVIDLCWISWRFGDWQAVEEYLDQAEDLARIVDQSQAELAETQIWRAVLARRAGNEPEARRRCRVGLGRMNRLRCRPNPRYPDVLSFFHELGNDLEKALAVRDRELQGLQDKGQFVYECRAHIKRCRLRARMGQLQEADVLAARTVMGKLRKPESYLAELDQACAGE